MSRLSLNVSLCSCHYLLKLASSFMNCDYLALLAYIQKATIPIVQMNDSNPIAFEVVKIIFKGMIELRQYSIIDQMMQVHERLLAFEHNFPRART